MGHKVATVESEVIFRNYCRGIRSFLSACLLANWAVTSFVVSSQLFEPGCLSEFLVEQRGFEDELGVSLPGKESSDLPFRPIRSQTFAWLE